MPRFWASATLTTIPAQPHFLTRLPAGLQECQDNVCRACETMCAEPAITKDGCRAGPSPYKGRTCHAGMTACTSDIWLIDGRRGVVTGASQHAWMLQEQWRWMDPRLLREQGQASSDLPQSAVDDTCTHNQAACHFGTIITPHSMGYLQPGFYACRSSNPVQPRPQVQLLSTAEHGRWSSICPCLPSLAHKGSGPRGQLGLTCVTRGRLRCQSMRPAQVGQHHRAAVPHACPEGLRAEGCALE